jgi:hypothetical protein
MAVPIAEIPAKVRLLQVDRAAFETLIQQQPNRLKHVGLAGAILPNQRVYSRLEVKLCLNEVSEVSYSEFGNMHDTAGFHSALREVLK